MLIGWRKKSLQIGVILGLLLFITTVLLQSSLRSRNAPNFLDSLALSVWSSNANLNTESDSAFNKRVTQLLEDRRTNDVEDVFWAIDTELVDSQTQLEIPSYFYKPDEIRQDVQPFDPRFTLAFYYDFIKKNHGSAEVRAPFHWADWMDMSILNKYLFSGGKKTGCDILDNREKEEELWKSKGKDNPHDALDPKQFCIEDSELPAEYDDGNRLRFGFNVISYPGRMTPEKALIAGRAYMYTSAPPPTSVIFLTDSGSYNLTTGKRQKLLHNGMVDDYIKRLGLKNINTLKEFRLLQKHIVPTKDKVVNDYEVQLQHKDFVLLPITIEKELSVKESQKTLNVHEKNYLDSIRFSLAKQDSPPKYFAEARIFDTAIGDHYDWRFFGGIKLFSFEQNAALHRMTRAWLSFCRKQGITTWMAHGSLLSWYWNGIAFPWDNDIDVQVPVMDLHKLGLYFNQSLIVEDANDGFGRYFLDCGS